MKKKKIIKMISLDTSTSESGVAIWENAELSTREALIKPKKENAGADWMIFQIINLLNNETPDIVIVEEESISRNMKTTRQLVMIIGAVKGWCIANNVFFDIYPPNIWRKLVAYEEEKIPTKREIAKAWAVSKVKDLYNINENNDNICEAILLGQAYINLIQKNIKK